MRMIRTPGWKLVRHFEPGGHDELYHLAKDPGEDHDLGSSSEPKHVVQRTEMIRRIEAWMTSIGDRVPAH
jgi:uncharacterized sulfatase